MLMLSGDPGGVEGVGGRPRIPKLSRLRHGILAQLDGPVEIALLNRDLAERAQRVDHTVRVAERPHQC